MRVAVSSLAVLAAAAVWAAVGGGATPGAVLARINFQPEDVTPPSGYGIDSGETFDAARGYGWDVSLRTKVRDENPDVRLDTHVYVRNSDDDATWEYALANGDYFVTVVAGSARWSGEHYVDLEGERVIDGVETWWGEFAEVEDHPVSVTDGRLSVRIGAGPGDAKTKICYLILKAADGEGGGTDGGDPPPPNDPPTATASASPATGGAPLEVAFTGSATDDGTVTYAWDFDDGNTSAAQSPTHTFTDAGEYSVTLTVTDDGGLTATDTVTVTVDAPAASAPPPAPTAGQVVARINFQPGGADVPPDYDPDAGAEFTAARGYGWDVSLRSKERDENADQRLDTYVYVSNDDADATWEYALANGDYLVTVVAGSPRWSGEHYVDLEGERVIDGVETWWGEFAEVEDHVVSVDDGRLSVRIGAGPGDAKTKICYLEIRTAGAPPDDVGLLERTTVEGLQFPTAPPAPPKMTAVKAFPNLRFDDPIFLTAPPGDRDRIFVAERDGTIWVFANDADATTKSVFLDLTDEVSRASSEEGLLGLAFDPDYDTNGRLYVYYSLASPRRSRVERYTVKSTDPDAADATSATTLLEFDQPAWNHNGGSLAFGPDGKLYIASGDGGESENAQDLQNLLGKILRINPDGTVPSDNPFVDEGRDEIWAYGLRNPWRMSFDRDTGDLWAGDVGQSSREEIDLVVEGANYGWRLYEADKEHKNPDDEPASNFTAPVTSYSHSDGKAVIGGYVYRGGPVTALKGSYLYGDYVSGKIWALVYADGKVVSNTQIATIDRVSSFGEDADGEVYVCCFDDNIYRFEDNSAAQAQTVPDLLSETGLFDDLGTLTPAPGLVEYDVNAPLWSDGARKRRWIAVPGSDTIEFHATEAWTFPVGTVLVKHFEIDVYGGGTERLETRVLVHTTEGWEGYTYRWNDAQTDATLLADAETEALEVPDGSGGSEDLTWTYPSRTDCMRCHTAAAGYVLGVRTRQLNRNFDYVRATANQLATWNYIRLFSTDIGEPETYEALTDPANEAAPLPERARSYLAANCAQCHLPGGPTPVEMDLRYGAALEDMNVVDVIPSSDLSAVPGSFLVDSGAHATSVIWELMGRLDETRMPPLGSGRVDKDGRAVIADWIDDGPE